MHDQNSLPLFQDEQGQPLVASRPGRAAASQQRHSTGSHHLPGRRRFPSTCPGPMRGEEEEEGKMLKSSFWHQCFPSTETLIIGQEHSQLISEVSSPSHERFLLPVYIYFLTLRTVQLLHALSMSTPIAEHADEDSDESLHRWMKTKLYILLQQSTLDIQSAPTSNCQMTIGKGCSCCNSFISIVGRTPLLAQDSRITCLGCRIWQLSIYHWLHENAGYSQKKKKKKKMQVKYCS